ncbi:MAG: carboxylate--amine ligase [Acidimicrobiales bacterium]|nr:MAG: carboxylate--amine ligase [Acidimicrobiales bacterium]
MNRFDVLPTLRSPVAVAAFTGWNDAGEAASGVLQHLAEQWGLKPIAALDPDAYYDFQVNRPNLTLDESGSQKAIEWSTTQVSYCSPPGAERDIVLIQGIEPNLKWRSFCEELIELCSALEVDSTVILGALLSDTPHTRPVPIIGSATDSAMLKRYELELSRYEGPTGIVGVLQSAFARVNKPAMSLWAQVPHYINQPPCPKATLALLNRLEDILDLRIPVGELPEEAAEWESTVNEAASDDTEMLEYINTLEQREGEPRFMHASGEELAAEFEKFLRRPGAQPE